MTYLFDTKAVLIGEILPILKKHGITLEAEKRATIDELTPNYAKNYIGVTKIPSWAVVAILCGVDPNNEHYMTDGTWNDGSPVRGAEKYSSLIIEGKAAGHLVVVDGFGDVDLFNQDDIRNWCSLNNVYWPIPIRDGASGFGRHTDKKFSELEAKLADALEQLKEHEASARFIREVTQERDSLREQQQKNIHTNAALSNQVAQLSKEKLALEADLAKGKSLSFLLELLGGVVTSSLYVDIFKEGNVEIGKVTSVLEAVGLTPTPESVSKYLKQAAVRLRENGKDTAIIQYLEQQKSR